MITIGPTTAEGIEHIAANMQREHREECEGACMSALEALQWSVNDAAVTEMARFRGEPMAVWGVNPTSIIGSHATVWMLGTDRLKQHPIAVCKAARDFVHRMNRRYPVLECVTDLRYHTGCSWVEWMGFREARRVLTPSTIFAIYRRQAA